MEDPTPYYTTKWDDVVAVQTGERTWAVTRPLCPGWHITETLAQRHVEQDWIRTCDVVGTDLIDGATRMSRCTGYIYPVTERYAAAWLDMYFQHTENKNPEEAPLSPGKE
jgi:hypothetical protein